MNDKDRDLIQSVLQAAGKAGEQGFAYLVQYTFWDGIFSSIGYAAALAGSLWLLRRAFRWAPPEDEDGPHIARAVAIVVCCIAAFCMLCGLEQSIAQAIQPAGAAIRGVLHHG